MLTPERITDISDKDTKSVLLTTFVSSTLVGSQKNWVSLTKETYAINLTFEKHSYYLYNAKIIIKCDDTHLHKPLTVHTLTSKVNNWGTEIKSMSHVTFEHIKGMENILAAHILRL